MTRGAGTYGDMELIPTRDVTAGATGATAVAPKFSDTLTLFQPGGADSAPTSQRSHQKIACDYISAIYKLYEESRKIMAFNSTTT